ncbi:MAG: ATP-binding cassette domain-containing protein [Mesorhizobium sp.]|nr:oligopeptide/dipeptide ABC transporter ATP-binding protein [Mesorhizobium sp.]MCO5161785.1 ATP-binding cassette domain-containing protein [Mesorhizobium sp.]
MTDTAGTPLLRVRDLKKHFVTSRTLFGRPTRTIYAVDGVSFDVHAGRTLSIVGESGCGKSTVGRTILRLLEPTGGEVTLDGERIDTARPRRMRQLRRQLQVVFQDPFSSLNPRMRVGDIIAEPIRNFGLAASEREIGDRIARLLDLVGLPKDSAERWPHQFSGGQRQRIGIGRALATEPRLIICDEAVSALDVSVRAQVINLLQDLQRELSLALLFISHDLAVVEHMSDEVAVMYLGKIVEIGDRASIFGRPTHPYTRALMSAVPNPVPGASRSRTVLAGDVPSPANPPSGCRFRTRCPVAIERCAIEDPALLPRPGGLHHVACHVAKD